jgi:tRNA U34 2-thiouridine synthase MnmA/TrmU
MSGGVDSSVTAKLLADRVHFFQLQILSNTHLFVTKDYDLSAVFMRNWDTRDESGTDKGCEWEKDWEDVQRVCKVLDLPCQMVNTFYNFMPTLMLMDADRSFERVLESCIRAFITCLGSWPNAKPGYLVQ